MNKEALYDLYITQELSTVEIGKKIGTSSASVSRMLKSNGIPARTVSASRKTKKEASRIKEIYDAALLAKIGKTYCRLTIISGQGHNRHGQIIVKCRCACGNETISVLDSVVSGHSRSCGCYRRERTIEVSTRHSLSNSRLYSRWHGMIQRCENQKHKNYPDYGGRGIAVCSEWHDSAVFVKWALASGYEASLTIDRIDNNGNYEPTNCKWSDRSTQRKNQRKRTTKRKRV